MTSAARAQPNQSTASNGRSTEALARFVTDTGYDEIPADIVHATKRMVLDEIIVAGAAMKTPMGRTLSRLFTERGGAEEATLIAGGCRLPAQSAAHIHAQLANLLDADETTVNRMHVVSANVMTGLAMAEKLGSSGRDLIAAIATGFDISARVGLSLEQFLPDGDGNLVFAPLFGWSWMTFGAAATAGRLVGLDSYHMQRAFGQALVTSPATFDVLRYQRSFWREGEPAAWHKYQMCGAASEAAVNAALLVSWGWVAQPDVLDDGSSFWRSYGAVGCDWDKLYEGLGETWHMRGVAVKPYPFCRFGHAALDIMTRIVAAEKFSADEIEEVVVRVAPHDLSRSLMKLTVVDEALKLMSSQPMALALVALGIPPGKWFQADLKDERVRSLARRMRHEVVEEWSPVLLEQQTGDGFFRRLPTEVTVRLKSGQAHSGYEEYARGDPWAPTHAMSDADLADKARGYLDGVLPAARIEALIEATMRLDEAPDISAVARAMAG